MAQTIRVRRYDIGGLRGPKKTPAGFLRADAYLTRTGIFEYTDKQGRKFMSVVDGVTAGLAGRGDIVWEMAWEN